MTGTAIATPLSARIQSMNLQHLSASRELEAGMIFKESVMSAPNRTNAWILAGLAASALLAPLAATASTMTADGQKEVATAIEHAHYASQSNQLDAVHLHLHHVINCMVGTNGEGFDAQAGDPCKGEGTGALNDLKASPARQDADQALALARVGVKIDQYSAARDVAKAVHSLLEQAHKEPATQ